MYNSILLGVKQQKFAQYSEAFNFFQSKSVNNIIAGRKLQYVIHFRDLEIFDDQTEYIKRYYNGGQIASRSRKLINYYELNMTPPAPSLLPVNHYKLIETNRRKHIKLMVMQQKSQARRNEQAEDEEDGSAQMILSKIDNSNFSELNSEKEESSNSDSYDSQPFYAFDGEEEELRDNVSFMNGRDNHIISIKEVADSQLVLDFKAMAEEPPKINVLPPMPPQPKVEKTSIGIQTLPQNPPKPLEKQLSRPVIIPELKKQPAISSNSQLQQRQVKKENMILTDSIEMVYRKEQQKEKKEKKENKASTFMEYYNSQPVKAPSNILERYIKRKK